MAGNCQKKKKAGKNDRSPPDPGESPPPRPGMLSSEPANPAPTKNFPGRWSTSISPFFVHPASPPRAKRKSPPPPPPRKSPATKKNWGPRKRQGNGVFSGAPPSGQIAWALNVFFTKNDSPIYPAQRVPGRPGALCPVVPEAGGPHPYKRPATQQKKKGELPPRGSFFVLGQGDLAVGPKAGAGPPPRGGGAGPALPKVGLNPWAPPSRNGGPKNRRGRPPGGQLGTAKSVHELGVPVGPWPLGWPPRPPPVWGTHCLLPGGSRGVNGPSERPAGTGGGAPRNAPQGMEGLPKPAGGSLQKHGKAENPLESNEPPYLKPPSLLDDSPLRQSLTARPGGSVFGEAEPHWKDDPSTVRGVWVAGRHPPRGAEAPLGPRPGPPLKPGSFFLSPPPKPGTAAGPPPGPVRLPIPGKVRFPGRPSNKGWGGAKKNLAGPPILWLDWPRKSVPGTPFWKTAFGPPPWGGGPCFLPKKRAPPWAGRKKIPLPQGFFRSPHECARQNQLHGFNWPRPPRRNLTKACGFGPAVTLRCSQGLI